MLDSSSSLFTGREEAWREMCRIIAPVYGLYKLTDAVVDRDALCVALEQRDALGYARRVGVGHAVNVRHRIVHELGLRVRHADGERDVLGHADAIRLSV
jgi:hypothetical protein